MKAGKLIHRVRIEQVATDGDGNVPQDESGQEVIEWDLVENAWAEVRPLRGREFLTAQQINAEGDTEIEIRFRSYLTAKHRIVHGTTVYNIKQAPPSAQPRDDRMILLCGQGLNNG